MPDESSPPSATTRIITALAGVGTAVVIFLIVLQVTRSPSADQLDDAQFEVGPAERLAERVADGGPFLFADPLGRGRDIFVQHLGGDNWVAFSARPPGALRECFLEWREERREFIDGCSGESFPADGEGLTAYPARVEDGRVIVNLRTSPTTTSNPPS